MPAVRCAVGGVCSVLLAGAILLATSGAGLNLVIRNESGCDLYFVACSCRGDAAFLADRIGSGELAGARLFPRGDGSEIWVQFSRSEARVSVGLKTYVHTGASGTMEVSVARDASLKLVRQDLSTGVMFTSRVAATAGFGVAVALAAVGSWLLIRATQPSRRSRLPPT